MLPQLKEDTDNDLAHVQRRWDKLLQRVLEDGDPDNLRSLLNFTEYARSSVERVAVDLYDAQGNVNRSPTSTKYTKARVAAGLGVSKQVFQQWHNKHTSKPTNG